ncbi:MAG: hypothetical protein H7Y37_09285 [Anaerolineae bacterium]|nr:hypothetical protein [Gloeobacterales cyanobacterium ES-bin-313]
MLSTLENILWTPEQRTMDFLRGDINRFAAIVRRRDLDREGKFQEALQLANTYYEPGSKSVP